MGVSKTNTVWLMPPLILSVLSILLFAGRVAATGSAKLAFLNWNLLLAWLPLLFAWWLSYTLKRQRWLSLNGLVLSLFWLLFLPNSFYIVTDFIHLSETEGVSLVYDAVMIMSFALTGLLLGCMSTGIVHGELIKRVSRRRALDIIGSSFLVSGLAIYLGRTLGYNSWDILANPFGLFMDVVERLANPGAYGGMYSMMLLFFIYISAVYTAYYHLRKGLKP